MTHTIVLMTISDLAKDSRTYKQALSLVRFGYRCIVLQGEAGNLDPKVLPFELRTIGRPYTGKKTQKGATTSAVAAPTCNVPRKRAGWKDRLPYWLRHGIPYLRYLYRQRSFQKAIKSQIPDADLYYIHYFDLFPSVKGANAIIYDAHDFHSGVKPKETLSTLERQFIKPWQKRKETACMQGSQAVVTVCDGLAKLMHETFERQPVVIRNCHDGRLDSYCGPPLREKLKLGPQDRLLATIGTAKDCMAFQAIFEALGHLPDNIHLVFLGNGYGPYLKGERYDAVCHRIHAPGAVQPYEIVPLIRDADAALLPFFVQTLNNHHGLPNGFFQSIAAGLPLLYPRLHEIVRIASQYDLGVPIDPLDPGSIQQGIEKLLSTPETLQRYRKNCQVADRELSWEREEIRFKNLIETVLSSHPKNS